MRNTQRTLLLAAVSVVLAFSNGCGLMVNGQPMSLGGLPGGFPQAPGQLTGPVTAGLPLQPSTTDSLLGTPAAPTSSVPAGAPLAPGSTAELDAWPGGKLPPQQFFQMLLPAVRESSRQTGVPIAVTLAQAALETGYGRASVGPAKNLFGMHGTGPAGSVAANDAGTPSRFRAYNSWAESIVDHDRTLATSSRYAGAMAVRNDPEAFAREIHRAGYATDPGYSDQLISIMRQYNLQALATQA